MQRALLLVLLTSLVLAGCATPTDDGGDGAPSSDDTPASPPPQMSNEAAGALLTRSATQMPEKFALNMSATAGGRVLMTFRASFDNTTDRTYVELTGDAEALGSMGGDDGAAEFLAQGITMFSSPSGSLYLSNGTAFVFPPSEETSEDDGGFLPRPEEGPFGTMFDGRELLGGFAESGVEVTSVTPMTYRNKPAVEVVARHTEDNVTTTGKLIVFTNPERVARLETTLPADPEEPTNPLNGALLAGDFYYEGELKLDPPASVTRSLGLGYKSAATGDGVTWTFFGDEGVELDGVEVQVKESAESSGPDASALATAWAFRLSEGTKTQDGLTLTFTDADGDGKVSPGDTLVADPADDAIMPQLLLHDRVTGVNVVPGFGLVALVAALGLALVVFRRR